MSRASHRFSGDVVALKMSVTVSMTDGATASYPKICSAKSCIYLMKWLDDEEISDFGNIEWLAEFG